MSRVKTVGCSYIAALIWRWSDSGGQLEVSVNGIRQGTTAKNVNRPEARSACGNVVLLKTLIALEKEAKKQNKACPMKV